MLHHMFCLRLEWLFSQTLQILLQFYLVSIVLVGLVAGQHHSFEVGALHHYTRQSSFLLLNTCFAFAMQTFHMLNIL